MNAGPVVQPVSGAGCVKLRSKSCHVPLADTPALRYGVANPANGARDESRRHHLPRIQL